MYPLRPQQVVFEDAIRKAFQGHRAVLGVAPTGFGKSVVIADMCYKAAAKGRDVLIVTNRRTIVKQLEAHCKRTGIRTGIIMASEEPDK
jgi:superfamily II DNA or RNA helicase